MRTIIFLLMFPMTSFAAPVPNKTMPDPIGRPYVPLFKYGFMDGDTITQIGEIEIEENSNLFDLFRLFEMYRPGAKILIIVIRKDKLVKLTIILE